MPRWIRFGLCVGWLTLLCLGVGPLVSAQDQSVEATPAPISNANPDAATESTTAAAPTSNSAESASDPLPQPTATILWYLIASAMVFFMQAGFALVEGGLTRAKNNVNIMSKNLLDFAFGATVFWIIGYALMYGESGNGFIGWDSGYILMGKTLQEDGSANNLEAAKWFFQAVFAATAATIVSGAMAERTKLASYVFYSILITLLIYPITGHWIWGSNGWLSGLGFRDFAGSTVVHSVGGWAALVGAWMVGPRLGKYGTDGKIFPIPGHNLPMASLGVFILWFGWYGFNCGSTLAAVEGVAHVALTSTLAAVAGTMAATVISWISFGKPDLTMSLNGCLAGLVGITAPCASVSGNSAIIIGLVAGILVFYSCLFIEKKLKIDDPVGAVSVHGICGVWGTLAVGLFGQRSIDLPFWSEDTAIQDGLLMGGGFTQFLVQLAGVGAVMVYTLVLSFLIFGAIHKTLGLRVSAHEETEGLDVGEHGMEAYPNFATHDPVADRIGANGH